MKRILLFLHAIIISVTVFGQSQNALDFDGIDDEVSVPGASALIAGSSQLSITCWVYPTNANPMYPDFDGFCGFRNELDCDFYLMQVSPAAAIEARFRNSSGAFFTITYQGLILNTWQHLALTYDGSMLRLYQGGVIADSVAASGVISNVSEPFHIGTLPYSINPYWLTGKLDEISLFNRVLNETEIACIAQESVNPADPGCMLFYNCNQGIADGVNTTITALDDLSGHIDGVITAFALLGTASNFVSGITNAASSAMTICQGDIFIFGNDTLTQGGFYYSISPLNGGCGNLQELNLTVITVDTSVSLAGETLTANGTGDAYQWVDCSNGYAVINGAIGQSFTPLTDGTYALVITQNGCVDTSSCYTVLNVGMNHLQADGFVLIRPNPVLNDVVISIRNSASSQITIRDIAGKIIYEVSGSEEFNIDASAWHPGVYIVNVRQGDISFYSRLVKY